MDIKVKIPENLNIVELLQAKNIEPKNSLVDKIAYFCSSIHSSAVNHRDLLEDISRPFFPLSSKILQIYIHDYKQIEQILKDTGVIESDGRYSLGNKSLGFRFTEKYYGQKHKEHEITSVGLHNKIQTYHKTDPLPPSPETRQYLFLKKFWTDGKLKMDTGAAMKWVNATEQSQLNYFDYYYAGLVGTKEKTAKIAGREKDAAVKKLTERVEIWKTSVENFNTGRLVFNADDFSKRLHTKLTNVKKELRGFITYGGKQLVSLDIKNSQPYLSLVLFNDGFWKERAKNNEKLLLYRKIGVDRIKEVNKKSLSNTIMLAKSSEIEAGKGFEFSNFMSLVTSGQLYEYIIEKYQEAGIKPDTRDAIKRQFLKYLYHKPSNLDQYEDGYDGVNLIISIFPNISQLFLLLKRRGYQINEAPYYQPRYQFPFHVLSAKESYKFPPQLLQRIESYLVLEIVCKELNKGNKTMPLFTIHDSIVTTVGYQQTVLDKMRLELTNAIGFEPTIKPELFTPLPADIKTSFQDRELTIEEIIYNASF